MSDDKIQIAIEAVDNASDTLEKVSGEVAALGKKGEEAGAGAIKGAQGFESFRGALVAAQSGIGLIREGMQTVGTIIDNTIGTTMTYAKEVRNLSTNLGITTEETSKLIQAADDYGISVETVTSALQMAVKRGLAPNIDTIAKLADEYNSIADPVERAARLTDVFGRGWTSLTPMLKAGGQAIREAADEAAKLGLVLSDKDVQSARNLEISVDNLNDRIEALKLKMGKDLIPAAINVTDAFGKFADVIQGTETPLQVMEREREYLISLTGRESDVVKAATKAIDDYKNAQKNAAEITDGVSRAEERAAAQADQLVRAQTNVGQGAYAMNGALDESERALVRTKEAAQAAAEALVNNKFLADATALAITYTEAQHKQADVQKELDTLNEQIASHGAKRTVTIKNEKMSAEELTRTQLQLAVAQEDLAGVTRKAGETDAEFALRVDSLKGKVSDYSAKLGEHTAVVCGATKAELEHKAALEGQIAELQKTDEINRAKGAFEALTAAFRSGALTEDQFKERSAALNSVANLYTESALKQATAQEVLMKSFSDPRSETWRGQLLKNEEAIDGVTKKTTEAKDAFGEYIQKLMQPVTVDVKIKPAVIDTGDDKARAAARDKAIEATETSSKKALGSVAGAAKDTTSAVSSSADIVEGKLTALATTTQTKFTTVANSIVGAFRVAGSMAGIDLFGIYQAVEKLPTYKEFVYQITVKGEIPSGGTPRHGAQYGADFIVPPNPRGGSSDYFPVMAAPGERVIVQTKAQQGGGGAVGKGGDTVTYNYNTNVYNPLAAAMLADKQRRDRIGRSNARMGV